MSQSVGDRVKTIVAETLNLPPDSITGATAQGNPPEWDSLGHLNVVLSLEQEFDLAFSPEEVEAMTTVDAIEACIAARAMPAA